MNEFNDEMVLKWRGREFRIESVRIYVSPLYENNDVLFTFRAWEGETLLNYGSLKNKQFETYNTSVEAIDAGFKWIRSNHT